VLDGHLYTYVGDAEQPGAFVCANLATGAIRWRRDNAPPGSVIAAGGCLLLFDGDGRLLLVRPDPTGYRELARARLLPEGRAWTPPSFARGVVYLRNARGDVVAAALPWQAEPQARPRLEIQGLPGEIEITWTPASDEWSLEQYLPGHPQRGWHPPAPEAGELATGRYRTEPVEQVAWYRLRQP
jgi:hypothetical protein